TGAGGFERLVVVKRLRAPLATSPELVQMLLDEGRIAATLQHGNIIQVHDVTLESGTVAIVMEYLHGQDARALMKRARARLPGGLLPLDQAIAIALGICAGLHHAHERVDAAGRPLDIVHRDVSPENVVVTYDGGVKLVDFGIARARSRMASHTEHGIAKGKPGYMAPEQILCRPVDRRADVYAAAVLLYEMTCGRLPHEGDSDHERSVGTVDRDPVAPRALVASYPAELEAIALRGLERDPERRYPTALEMQRALERFARARRLDLSSFGLAQLMERLCSDKLDAWRTAQREGRSLAEHVSAMRTATGQKVAAAEEVPAAAAETPARPAGARRRRLLIGAGLVAAAAAGIAWWGQGRSGTTPAAAMPQADEVKAASPAPARAELSPPPAPEPAPEPEPAVAEPPPAAKSESRRKPPVRRAGAARAKVKVKVKAPAAADADKLDPPVTEKPADPDAFLPY
ncbi:MAG TPA: serine/threonine-protein kinase, partial [Kofleriaceae bacterium]|nr:serine/threonine-protein kinase [Kofleriaceae bacterium]